MNVLQRQHNRFALVLLAFLGCSKTSEPPSRAPTSATRSASRASVPEGQSPRGLPNRSVALPSLDTAGSDACREGPKHVLGAGAVSQPIAAFGELRGLLAWRAASGVELRLWDADGALLAAPVTPTLPRFVEPRHIVLLPHDFVVFVDTSNGCRGVGQCRSRTFVFRVGLDGEVSTLAELALDGQRVLMALPAGNDRLAIVTERSEWIDLTLGGRAGFAAVGHVVQLMPYVAAVGGEGEPLIVTADWRGHSSVIGAQKRWDLPGPFTSEAVGASASTRLLAERDREGRVHLMWTAPPKDGQRQVTYGQLVGDELELTVETNLDAAVRPPFRKYVFANCCERGEFTRRSWPDDALRGAQPTAWDARYPAPLDLLWNGRTYLLVQHNEKSELMQTAFDCR